MGKETVRDIYTNRYIDFCLLDFNLVKCELKPSVHLSSCHTLLLHFHNSHIVYITCVFILCIFYSTLLSSLYNLWQPMFVSVRSWTHTHSKNRKKAVKMENCFTTHRPVCVQMCVLAFSPKYAQQHNDKTYIQTCVTHKNNV